MKKKNIVLLLGLVIILSGWWFTSGSSQTQPEQGVLDVWATWGDKQEQLQELFDRYNQAPIRVTTRIRSDDLMKAFNENQAPDLVILSGADLVETYAQQGLIERLDPWIESRGIDLEDIYTAFLKGCQSPDGSTLCLPWGSDMEVLYWNKNLFAAAGLDPEQPPQTMQELLEYAAELTLHNEAGELVQAGFIANYPHAHSEMFLRSYGESNLTFDSPNIEDAMDWENQIVDLYAPGEIDDFVASFTPYSSSSHPVYAERRLSCQQCHRASLPKNKRIPEVGFFEGKVAMMLDGQWLAASKNEERLQFNYGVAPFPPLSSDQELGNTPLVQGPVVIIPAAAVDKEAASHLLAWMNSPKVLAKAAFASSLLPSSYTAAQDPIFQQSQYSTMLIDLISSPKAETCSPLQNSFESSRLCQAAE
jgi:multiple sugar transport system substrate-binding protein